MAAQIRFISVQSQKAQWLEEVRQIYTQKISRFLDFEEKIIKSPPLDRSQSAQKKKEESILISKSIEEKDFVVLLSEKGKEFSSEQFAIFLQRLIQQKQNGKIVFIVGGAFGVSVPDIGKVDHQVSLSKMVMNHQVATAVMLEQIYRALTIIHRIPYHNE